MSVPAPARAAARPTAGAGLDLPGWPLLAAVGGMPAWWLLGLTPVLPAAYLFLVTGLILWQRRPTRLRILPGTGPLVAFVAWAVPCVVMIDTAPRLIGFGVRWTALAAAALAVVHIANSTALTTRRLLGALASLWALVVVGGYLGVLWPDGGFTTPMARVVPGSLLANELVHDLLAPHFAEVQQPWGAAEPFNRPSAPFAYTNGWGWAVAFLTPAMLALRARLHDGRARAAVLLGIAASLVPAVQTRNRGMLLMAGVWVLLAIVGLAARGHVRAAALAAGGVGAAVLVFARLDLVGLIAERAEVSDSAGGRAEVYTATLRAALESPLLGYGAPRPSEDIGVALGTQGALWMYLFSYGLVGAALFVAFLIGVAVRGARLVDPTGLWLHAAACAACVALAFYGLEAVQLFALAVACGIVLRQAAVPRVEPTGAA